MAKVPSPPDAAPFAFTATEDKRRTTPLPPTATEDTRRTTPLPPAVPPPPSPYAPRRADPQVKRARTGRGPGQTETQSAAEPDVIDVTHVENFIEENRIDEEVAKAFRCKSDDIQAGMPLDWDYKDCQS